MTLAEIRDQAFYDVIPKDAELEVLADGFTFAQDVALFDALSGPWVERQWAVQMEKAVKQSAVQPKAKHAVICAHCPDTDVFRGNSKIFSVLTRAGANILAIMAFAFGAGIADALA
ncbi:MAG: hypothetical protein AAGK38_11165, partial [Pseudomonadota bacterium]